MLIASYWLINARISNTSEDTKKDLIDDNYAIVIENGIAQIVKILNSREESQNG